MAGNIIEQTGRRGGGMNQNVIFGGGEWDDEQYSDVFDLLARPAWHRQAACRGLAVDGNEPNPFFPNRGDWARQAAEVCSGCQVKTECAEAGMSQKFGVWGGLPERQRRKLRRANRAA
jgi:WhiB family redox-sensing transcriptional regulator